MISNYPKKVLQLFALLLLITIFNYSCKKDLSINENILTTPQKDFFTSEKKLTGLNKVLYEKLKLYNKENNFITSINKSLGTPIWDKVIVNLKSKSQNLTSSGEDSLLEASLPLTNDNIHLSSILHIEETSSNNFEINTYTNQQFYNITHSSEVSNEIKKKWLAYFALLDNNAFDVSTFTNIPKSIFFPNNTTSSSVKLNFNINPTTNLNNYSNCVTIFFYEISDCPSGCETTGCGCKENFLGDMEFCTTEGGEGGGLGGGESGGGSTGGGGGGSGGGSGGGEPNPCGGTIENPTGGGTWYRNENCLPPPIDLTDSHGYYYSRLNKLDSLLNIDKFTLDPCIEINKLEQFGLMWQGVANYQVPTSLINRIDSVNNLFTSSAFDPPMPMYQQTLTNASGAVVNCDFFPINITQLPTGFTAESLLDYFRKNLNDFSNATTNWQPYTYTLGGFGPSINDATLFNESSQNSVGSLVHIGILGNAGTVMQTNYSSIAPPLYNYEHHSFIYSTLFSPLDFSHPVAGNRQFGIYNSPSNPNKYTFYTMGVDRIWNWLDDFAMRNTCFGGGDALWTSMQEKMKLFINTHGGQADNFVQQNIIARPNYGLIEQYLRKEITLAQLKTALGC